MAETGFLCSMSGCFLLQNAHQVFQGSVMDHFTQSHNSTQQLPIPSTQCGAKDPIPPQRAVQQSTEKWARNLHSTPNEKYCQDKIPGENGDEPRKKGTNMIHLER